MTWLYQIDPKDNTRLKIWSHTQDPTTDSPTNIATNENGWHPWSGLDDPVERAMEDGIHSEYDSDSPDVEFVAHVLFDKEFRNISAYSPNQ